MKFRKRADDMLKELGFEKQYENGFGATYKRWNSTFCYYHTVEINYSEKYGFTLSSFDSTNNHSSMSWQVSLTQKELEAFLKKMKEMG